MTMISLGDALDRALSDKELIGEATGVALAEKKAATTVGAEVAVSFTLEEFTPTANGLYAARRIPTGPKASHAPARSVGIRLVTINGVRVDHARSLSVGAGTSKRRLK